MIDRTILEQAFDAGFDAGRDDTNARRIAAPRMTFQQQMLAILGSLTGGTLMILGMGELYEENVLGIAMFVGGLIILGVVIGSLVINARRKLSQVNALMEIRREEERHAFVQEVLDNEDGVRVIGPADEVIVGEGTRVVREPLVNERLTATA